LLVVEKFFRSLDKKYGKHIVYIYGSSEYLKLDIEFEISFALSLEKSIAK
jgi:hypothetical protein